MTNTNSSDQVVVVTGASGGLGASIAQELGRRGAAVVLAARREGVLREMAARCGERALPVVADMTKREDAHRLFDQAIAKFGRVDIWINNVGRGQVKTVLDLTDEDLDTMMRDNLKSVVYGMQAVVPHLKARGTGAIVNVSSLVARMQFPLPIAAYAASKAAMSSVSEAMRKELASTHPAIRVVVAYPGVIATDFGANALGMKGDSRAVPGAQDPDEAARVVCDAAFTARGDVYTQTNGLALVREYMATLTD